MLIAVSCAIICIFLLQTFRSNASNTSLSKDKLDTVKEKLKNNEEYTEVLTDTLSADNLAKTRAFADILKYDRLLLKDIDRLIQLKDRLKVSELHIIDKNGTELRQEFVLEVLRGRVLSQRGTVELSKN